MNTGIFLTSIISVLHSSVTDTVSDDATAAVYLKAKLLLAEDENAEQALNRAIENSIVSGYYYALYYCVDECRKKAKANPDRTLLIELNNIEKNIGVKQQQSDNADIKKIFADHGGVTLFIGAGAEKEKIEDLTYKLLSATFDKMFLPQEYQAEAEAHLFERVKSFFTADIKENGLLISLLEKLLALLKDDFGDSVTIQVRERIRDLFKPRYSGIDGGFEKKIQLIRKYGALYGVSPLKEAVTVDLKSCPSEMLELYKTWESRRDSGTETEAKKRKNDILAAPRAKDENRTERFTVSDDIANGPVPARLFFVICRSESPTLLYPVQAAEVETDPKKSRIYRTYEVNTACRIGGYYNIVSVLLHADHALVQTARLKSGGSIEEFGDTRSVAYTYGSQEADFSERDLEAEVCYSVDNPFKVLTFIDVHEKCIVMPKTKYDYELETKYGSLTLLRNGVYLALQLNFALEKESVPAIDFYNALRDEASSEYIPLQFALIIKNRLTKILDLYTGKYAQDVLKYSRDLFCWTTLSADSEHLESEMDSFSSYLTEILKKEKDIKNILGLSDLQACAVYNKALANKREGRMDKAVSCLEQAVQIVKMIKSIQPDYPLKKDLSFYESALKRIQR